MYKIKKIKVMSLAYTVGLVYLFFGLILGVIIALAKENTALSFISNETLAQLTLWQIILIYPVSYGVGGFIISIIIGLIYNQIAKITGGISVELKKDSWFSK